MLCSIGFIAKHYGVSPSTIRRWVKLGYIRIAGRTFGGHRRFDVPNEVSSEQALTRKHIGYARVIVPRSKGGFGRQSARLREAGCEEVIEDIAVHISLNPHPEDVLTDIELQNIADRKSVV